MDSGQKTRVEVKQLGPVIDIGDNYDFLLVRAVADDGVIDCDWSRCESSYLMV